MANKQLIFCGNCKEYLKEELTAQSNESNGGAAFRIPSLVNANGTLIAAIDKAATGADWGYIEIAVRRSEDGGKTWSDIETIASPPARKISTDINNTKTAFFIDPCMTVAPNGDVVMLITYFPECKGIHNKKILDKKKVAYASFDGEQCPVIYDRDGNFYLVLDNGTVLDKNKQKTPYKVTDWQGSLYKDDEYVGNIYLNGAMRKTDMDDKKTTFGAPLKSPKRSYVFMLKSTDQGKTWSEPKDITGSILNQDDGVFLAVAPGSGLTTSSGRILMPLYTLKGTVCVYSDDNGNTWHRLKQAQYTQNIDEWSAVEAPDKTIFSFGRQRTFGKTPVSISKDGGFIWEKGKKVNVKAPKCQKNSIVIGDKVYISHPSGRKRENGVISIGTFELDKKGKVKDIRWEKEDIKIDEGFFAYSCMAKIDDDTIGILYEAEPSSYIVFETFKVQ